MYFQGTRYLTAWIFLAATSSFAEEAEKKPEPQPFSPPSIKVREGFTFELAARPPLVEHPMMAGFDDRGRLYVAESAGENLENVELEKKLPNFIRRLEDTDGDGVFDKTTIFADKMTYPMGALWMDGSLYVASPPSIWKLTDTNDDGVADRREEIVGRFGYIGNAADIHGCFAGPGGRIYWCDGRHGHRFTTPDGKVKSQGQAARIFSANPDGSDVRVHCGGGMDNPVEIDFTPEGEMLGTVNLLYNKRGDCLVHWMHGGVYPREDQQKAVDEFKKTGDLLTPVIDLGHVAVSGMLRYRSQTFGPEYDGNVFLCEFNTHKVRRVSLTRDGSTFQAKAEDMLVCDSIDFHPTDVIEDADGSLLVIDTGGWFRYGCPTSQIAKPNILGAIYRVRKKNTTGPADPRGLKLAWDGVDGDELTRRLVDDRFAVRRRAAAALARQGNSSLGSLKAALQAADPRMRLAVVDVLARMESDEARAAVREKLRDEDPSVRQSAVNAVGWAGDAAAVPRLREIVVSDSPPLRREAATSLGKIGDASAVPALLAGLRSETDRLLEHALIYALIEIDDSSATLQGLADASPQVRRGALIALDQMDHGNLSREAITPLLDSSDTALQAATLAVVAKHPEWAGEIIGLMEQWIGGSSIDDEHAAMIRGSIVAFAKDPKVQELVARALKDADVSAGTKRVILESVGRSGLKSLPESWIEPMRQCLIGPEETLSREAISALATTSDQLDDDLIRLGIDVSKTADLRAAAIAVVARHGKSLPAEAFSLLLEQCDDGVIPAERMLAADALGSALLSNEQLLAMLDRVGKSGPLELPLMIHAYSRSDDAGVGARLIDVLKLAPGASSLRPAVIEQVFSRYPENVRLAAKPIMDRLGQDVAVQSGRLTELEPQLAGGNALQGKLVFQGKKAACATCHRVGAQGGIIGPDLSTIGKIRTARDLAEAIAFPSASLARGFQTYTVVLENGEVHSGVLSRETADAVFLRTAQRNEVRLPRKEIESIAPSDVSVMPQGLDRTLSIEEFRDLVAYLESLK
ncbi:MAG: PVC-type heme-binding CxxCH protein [Planctomycetota bacterium]